MLILPKILYTFRTLPVPIPHAIFNKLHSKKNNYIWQKRRPRISFRLMTRHPRMGGLGLPNLQAYHFAMTMGQIKHWCYNNPLKPWVRMESAILAVREWRGLLLDPIPNPAPPITATLSYWKTVFTEQCLQPGASHTSIPLSFLPLHIPHMNIDHWATQGLNTLEDLYDGASLRSFENLKEKYRLPNSDYIRYTQIHHLLKQVLSKQRALPTGVLGLPSLPLTFPLKGSRVFYNLYTGNNLFIKTCNMVKWEAELNKQFSPAQWQTAIT